ncbi:MAG: SsrA-binding protein SmpB [Bacteroidales bacterium]|nr:SsrA-binding protein SmpB [Bacteroidales bacterium]
MANVLNIKNKKARHNYELLDKFIAGIQLYGTEIKSIRAGKVSLNDSYCVLLEQVNKPGVFEVWVKMHISEYTHGTYSNHEPKRNRKLLLNRKEIDKIVKKVKASSLTIVPTRLFINDRGLAKLEIAIARGKKYHDKRQSLKQNDDKREMDKLKKMRL